MFAAFPGWYATMFSGMYLAMVLLLISLMAGEPSRERSGPRTAAHRHPDQARGRQMSRWTRSAAAPTRISRPTFSSSWNSDPWTRGQSSYAAAKPSAAAATTVKVRF